MIVVIILVELIIIMMPRINENPSALSVPYNLVPECLHSHSHSPQAGGTICVAFTLTLIIPSQRRAPKSKLPECFLPPEVGVFLKTRKQCFVHFSLNPSSTGEVLNTFLLIYHLISILQQAAR